MGSFANTLFSVLFGWLRSAVQWLWNCISQPGENSALAWIGENWMKLALGLCVGGMMIDLIVYLLRWQPYKVWGSFWRRVTGKGSHASEDSGRVRRQWIYADGTTQFDEVEAESEEEMGLAYPAAYMRPVQPAEEASEMEKTAAESVESNADRAFRRRRYRSEESEMPLRYAPPPAAETASSYRAPYYPPQWRNPVKDNASVDAEGGGL